MMLMQMMRILPDRETKIQDELEQAEELDGKLGSTDTQALMKTVLENDKTEVEDGKFVNEMINQNMSSFQPDIMMQQFVQNYKNAEKIYGESLIREATGMSSSTVERNIRLPEFQRDLKSKLAAKARDLERKGILNRKGEILEAGKALAQLQLFTSQLDRLQAQGIRGETFHKKIERHGEITDVKKYSQSDSFKNIAWKKVLKQTLRRGRTTIHKDDLMTHTRQARGEICLIYALDASGSMRGKKIAMAKRAGVALAYKATQHNDKVGAIVFSDIVQKQVRPTKDFLELLDCFTEITASKQTDMASAIEESLHLFPAGNMTKHLLFITDGQVTVGEDPKKRCIEAASHAHAAGITISIIGINLDPQTIEFVHELTSLSKGKVYIVDSVDNLDLLVLRDYEQYQ
jgi:Mg-chelatase subunit ChlD